MTADRLYSLILDYTGDEKLAAKEAAAFRVADYFQNG